MIESWMVSIGIGILTFVFGYGMLKGKLANLEDNTKDTRDEEIKSRHDLDKKLDAQFRRVDFISERCTKIESSIVHLLSMEKADEKFVSKGELSLHLRSIDKELVHMTKNSDIMVGKLDDLTSAFSSYIVKEKDEK